MVIDYVMAMVASSMFISHGCRHEYYGHYYRHCDARLHINWVTAWRGAWMCQTILPFGGMWCWVAPRKARANVVELGVRSWDFHSPRAGHQYQEVTGNPWFMVVPGSYSSRSPGGLLGSSWFRAWTCPMEQLGVEAYGWDWFQVPDLCCAKHISQLCPCHQPWSGMWCFSGSTPSMKRLCVCVTCLLIDVSKCWS